MERDLVPSTDRQAAQLRKKIEEIGNLLDNDQLYFSIAKGLPPKVVSTYQKSLRDQKTRLENWLYAYENAKEGNPEELKRLAGRDPGKFLLVARVVRGLSQKELARRIGIKEQQVQRYEAENYRSITMENYKRFLRALNVTLNPEILDQGTIFGDYHGIIIHNYSADEVRKVAKHARHQGWFNEIGKVNGEEKEKEFLQKYVNDHLGDFGSPALLRTGLNIVDVSEDLGLVAWKARVTRCAEKIIRSMPKYEKKLNIEWLRDLVLLSREVDGPLRAQQMLAEQGIVLIVEPHISGLRLDGAAFLVRDFPVIGMTIRRDTIDNFWFTLMHELGHIILHYDQGLSSGFFDDSDEEANEQVEKEANEFASEMLIPEEIWRSSSARIARSPEPAENLAARLGIHSAIVFGRIQKERNKYNIFANRIGRGMVKKLFLNGSTEEK